jgi:Rha family phage regulatory protein
MSHMTTALTIATPIVTLKDGQAFANSRDVADFFGKQHVHVLRDIDALVSAAPDASSNFGLCPYQSVVGGRMYRAFDMTKDGFTLLAMGFTGAKALEFKLKYIAAFNELERKLRDVSISLPDFSNPAAAARAWADEVEQKQALQIENRQLKPMAAIGERAASHQHTLNRFMRTLPGVNTLKVKSDLKAI